MAGRDFETLINLRKELGFEERTSIKQTDVQIEAECQDLIEHAIRSFGALDLIISNAGLSMHGSFADTDQNTMERLMDTNYWASVYLARHGLRHLQESRGMFVGVSSIGGYIGLPGRHAYSSSKAALRLFLEVLRMEVRSSGVHVLNVAPGFTKTNIRRNALMADGSVQGFSPRDESKMAEPADVSLAIIRAIKRCKRDLLLSFQGKSAISLRRLFPHLADRYFEKLKIIEDKNRNKMKEKYLKHDRKPKKEHRRSLG